jgi:manganese/zinc/iron transport system substrate-binding protein
MIKYISLFILIILLSHCNPSTTQNSKKIKIVCTTGIVADAVENIIKNNDNFEIIALMQAGTDPHLYKATNQDIVALRQADIIFLNGLHLEGKMAEVLEKFSKQKTCVALGDSLNKSKLLKINDNQYDPHIWFDVKLWIEVTKLIEKNLTQKFPSHQKTFHQNTQEYIKQLEILDKKALEMITQIPKKQRVLITAHDAFEYFGRAYQIEVKALQGISTLSEFGLKDVSDLINFIIERKIKAVFVESSIPKKSLEAVVEGCKQKKHQIKIGGMLYADALGAKNTKAGSYIGMFEENLDTIVKNLIESQRSNK